ncbi:MAG: peptide chain release factor N(5)-glutamine methyltransferase [Clostridia bacterium]|nr:peptide chain release factor N(5)-glutamine methyltransferase [Clostridiales bacterium]MDD7165590.1 peptide chain release factor N(5)-glutamine methyltransferase [Clostridia bacterium]MDY2901385.1 peptide chain release factor N(5)-glutamine methyltransferase [Christensenellaceae bacterium]
MKEKKVKKTSIGGQAVLEGVMMRGKTGIATAVRDSDGTIRIEAERITPPEKQNKFLKLPIIRGVVNFFSSLVVGTKILMRSAEVYGGDDEEPSKFEKWLAKTFKIDVMDVVLFFGVALGLVFSIALFFILPTILGNLFGKAFPDLRVVRNLIEGLIRIAIFIGYILFTSLLKDIKRTYMYHGAEHKTITCYEKGLDLTVENVKKCRRVHDRCGTTFMFFVMLVSILVYSVFGAIFPQINENIWLRILSRVVLLPLIAGLSYELLKLLAKTDSPLVLPLKIPGLLLQKLTTKEPDDGMMEVAIAAFEKVLKMDEDPDEPVCKFVCPEKVSVVKDKLKKEFSAAGIDESDAEWIVSIVSGIKRSELSGDKKLKSSEIDKINELAAQRLTGKPLCYVLGNCDFYGYEIKVDERVLIPRPETEELVSEVLKVASPEKTVLDLCTGSGAIALVVSKKSGAKVIATDISEDALEVAKENFKLFDADIKTELIDLYGDLQDKFDIIVSNPPYIKTDDMDGLDDVVKNYEPHLALDGGADGLDFYRRICAGAKAHLNDGGMIFLEVGIGQADDVKKMLDEEFNAEIIKDISGVDRIIRAGLK